VYRTSWHLAYDRINTDIIQSITIIIQQKILIEKTLIPHSFTTTPHTLLPKLTNIRQNPIIELGLILPQMMIVRRPGFLDSFQDFVILFGDSLEFSLSTILVEGMAVLCVFVFAACSPLVL
jgi:hypothetical protein